jgi:hypothetical protein
MSEYRIGEMNNSFWIEHTDRHGNWHRISETGVPRFFETLADARSWVATIKRGVVYHDAEDATAYEFRP